MSMALLRRFATLLQIPIPRNILLASMGMVILFLALDAQMLQSLEEGAWQLAGSLAAFWHASESFALMMAAAFLLALFAVGLRSVKAWQEHQRVYEQLRKEQEYARSIIDCSMTMIIGTDKERNIKEFNRAAEATYGYSAAEVRGQPVTMLYSGDQESLRVGEEMRAHGFFTGEVISRKKSGEMFSIFISATLLRDPQGGILGAVGNSRDLTGEKLAADAQRAKEAAELASEAKSRFLANMSHEIRTPMNAVIGMTDLLLEQESDDVKRGYLTIVLNSARTLLNLINDILDFSKIESGKMVLEQIVFDVRQLLEDTVATLEISAHAKGLVLALEVDDALPDCLVGDPTRLQQVFMNLLGNAIKFTHVGQVTVMARVEEASEPGQTVDQSILVRFGVRDTGIGIPENRLEAIFESFTQADTSTTRTFGGTGLGVTIAKEIVALMGGRLQVTSRVGEGSTFYFVVRLPVSSQSPCRRGVTGPGISSDVVRLFNILLVEDMKENVVLARLRLERLGHQVRVARDGREALALWEQGGLDLILMDVHMPHMDGYAATRVIREREAVCDDGIHIPVIAMTAAAMQSDQEACLASGMDAYVSKPIDFSRLSMVMEQTVPSGKGQMVDLSLDHAGSVVAQPGSDGTQAGSDVVQAGSDVVQAGSDVAQAESVVIPISPVWQNIPGINVALGMSKWGNLDVYSKTLIGFARKHAEDAQLVRAALARQDILDARSIVHAIKGAAGTLAASDLEAAALALETALRQRKEEDGDMEALLVALKHRNVNLDYVIQHFEMAMAVVIDSCKRLVPTEENIPLDGTREETLLPRVVDANGKALLATVIKNLTLGHIAGVEEGVRELHSLHLLRQTERDQLLEQLDELELDQTLALLRGIADLLGIDLKKWPPT